jgi:hypothetical protein
MPSKSASVSRRTVLEL